MPQAAIFVDRDGTLVEETHHLARVEDLRLLPAAAPAIRQANRGNRPVLIVTNQSAVARGLLSEQELEKIHRTLLEMLAREGASVDGIYYCPHHPRQGLDPYRRPCPCRKPQPGLLLEAARGRDLDLPASFMIGDHLKDVEAGHRAGCRSILVRTGYGASEEQRLRQDHSLPRPERVCPDVLDAVNWILEQSP